MLAKASLVKPALPAPPRVVADASRCDLRAPRLTPLLPTCASCLTSLHAWSLRLSIRWQHNGRRCDTGSC